MLLLYQFAGSFPTLHTSASVRFDILIKIFRVIVVSDFFAGLHGAHGKNKHARGCGANFTTRATAVVCVARDVAAVCA